MAVLDANDKGAVAASMVLTTQTKITTYIKQRSGEQGNYRIGLEISPDSGISWFDKGDVLRGPGILTCECVATNIRAVVLDAQGGASSIDVFILAR